MQDSEGEVTLPNNISTRNGYKEIIFIEGILYALTISSLCTY
jgi:hypothetical protein